MDIPNTGAIFTLGKSYLAENTHSYFYIKNDPIKRLISGPHQSAVICESGRLFVWGENQYGQLGIGGNSHSTNNHNNNNNNSYGEIITKPTCVKSLKALGLKIADIAFGSNWAVILTYSNELFFTGQNVFANETNVARNFTEATVANESCSIIRKPFRMEEFDQCLSNNEDTENFVSVLAGHEHFVVMTSFGRLLAWGSNENYQLGTSSNEVMHQPCEIVLDSPIQQYTCGPESTLVLTENGGLYLTGRLNEFIFSQFTELQKNLSSTEQIIFMHISKASEIYIVTNSGSIYRSIESLRNKSLIFQRFYDYDSEENGPIWKLLKGFSFYTVLTKANKFYTTFSESGHHLKTFREISKFKNLRIIDMAVGDQHILVHGIPKSSTLSMSVGPSGEHRFMSRSFVMNGNGSRTNSGRQIARDKILEEGEEGANENNNNNTIANAERKETPKPNTPVHENGTLASSSLVTNNKTAVSGVRETLESVGENAKRMTIDAKQAVENAASNAKQAAENAGNNAIKAADSAKNSVGTAVENALFKVADNTKNAVDTVVSKISHGMLEEETNQKNQNANAEGQLDIANENVSNHKEIKENHVGKAEITSIVANVNTTTAKPEESMKETKQDIINDKSPTESIKSRKSIRSLKFEPAVLQKADSSSKLLRPRTPYPEGSNGGTPQALKRTPLRNYSYEAAMNHEYIEQTSPALIDSLENIPESVSGETAPITAIVSSPTPPTEEDEQLTVEINTTRDALDHTILVNEIRFINNGIDVTANVKQKISEESEEESDIDVASINGSIHEPAEETYKEAEGILDKLEREIDAHAENVKEMKNELQEDGLEKAYEGNEKMERKYLEARTAAESMVNKTATDAWETVNLIEEDIDKAKYKTVTTIEEDINKTKEKTNTFTDKVEAKLVGARETVEAAAKTAATGARETVESVGENAKRMAIDAKQAVENAGSNAKQAVENAGNNAIKAADSARNSVGTAVENALFKVADNTKYAVDTVASKISHGMHDAKENLSSLLHGKQQTQRTPDDDDNSSKDGGAKTNTTGEDDERTTASVNSNQNSTGNPFEGSNPFESNNPFENESDDAIQRGKRALRDEVMSTQRYVEHEAEDGKGKVRQFFSDMRAKSKNISCRNEKSIQVDDEPPRYAVNGHSNTNNQLQPTSKVCVLL